MAVFVKKSSNYDVVHYDPNHDTRSLITKSFIQEFGKNATVRAHNSSCGNTSGSCTYLSWIVLLSFIIKLKDPFNMYGLLHYCGASTSYLTPRERQRLLAKNVIRERATTAVKIGSTVISNETPVNIRRIKTKIILTW